ncbi:TSUP family transporter [Burkholderia ubonensis]|uniref:TSUP family transporter n=1 Tax=Burkholderia ubonensis TaxID=101571 RepID=UPI000757F184|nr:TSUP family transporter [Burkholderia ubonensis]KVD61670.1 hypothetical protein WI87_10165 [Burkholderia ubonensis]KVT27915.1 hypothetical protein WK48_18220 [Burkholderia ubonensis]KVW62122.1 hypothetical protein WK99_15255 [Burkholderia ubonensis]OJA56013.1 hypothetical protein BGV69_19925 [Burkholderia ubonensis]
MIEHLVQWSGIGLHTFIFLVVGAACAGFIDSICGGGGLISIPVLLMGGFSPAQAIAANKLQGTLGAVASTQYYLGKKVIDARILRKLAIGAVGGGLLGTLVVNFVGNKFMTYILPVMLIAMAVYFAFSSKVSDVESEPRMALGTIGMTLVPLIGFYDGFFGPGAGTFYMTCLISVAGLAVTQAMAYSRVLNLISNATSLILFIVMGKMVWGAGIAMSIGEVAGVYAGSHLVHKNGVRLVKPLVVLACIAMAAKSIMG